MKTIVLDPGHGGSDPGACGNGLQEATLTEAICEHIKAKLQAYDVKVAICPQIDSLIGRAAYANTLKADYYCSIHINAGGGTGYESYTYTGTGEGEAMRNAIHDAVAAFMAEQGLVDRGKKVANFAVLRLTAMPASLHELLFIDTASDAAKLADSTFMYGMINAIAYGLAVALGLQKKPEPAVVPVVDMTKEAIDKLAAAGVITTPTYWRVNAAKGEVCRGEYVADLIKNMASKL